MVGRDEHIVFVAHEAQQDAFQLVVAHLAVTDADATVGEQLLDGRRARKNTLDAIVNEVHLSAAAQFLIDRGTNQLGIEMRDHGVDRQAILGWRFDHAHIADAPAWTCAACVEWAWRSWSARRRSCGFV
jgi:hypothetical protein